MLVALLLAAGVTSCTADGNKAAKSGRDVSAKNVGSGDRYRATIRRTTDGVPHITGMTLADAAFGQGWASGEDRSCDLADQIVKIRGERAKFLGAGESDVNINSDVTWRTIGIFDRASEDWVKFPKQSADLVTAFANGWNAHLKEVGVAGVAGWCKGADWVRPVQPVEVYSYARSVALLGGSGAVANYIASAAPPVPEVTASATAYAGDRRRGALASMSSMTEAPVASNGWAIGSKRSANGRGMLLANPHFPWEGELRFWEVQLTVPGEVDIYGVQLSGLPGIGIGFTKNFGWTHTVSAGNRFTAYKLALEPGSPTSYRYGDQVREMTPTQYVIDVKGEDGKLSAVTRTTWRSHYGPIINFPGLGWTDQAALAFRDANIDNDEFLEQYLLTMKAKNLDEFIKIQETVNGVPLFNTIATSADGRAWYADTSATPNLSKEALAAYQQSLTTDTIAKTAADNGAIVLDGSDPRFEWVDEPGARDPGLVPAARQPQMERDDYVFNANDSFWIANAAHPLTGDYSPLHGAQDTARSPRTRQNATVLSDTSPSGAAGADGKFTLDELADASLHNAGFMADSLRADVVERCQAVSSVNVAALPPVAATPGPPATAEVPGLPAAAVDIRGACSVLAGWDGVYDLDSVGAPLWREFLARYKPNDLKQAGPLWARPFDATRPIETPSGLAPAPAGGDDPILINVARAVQALGAAGFDVTSKLGDVQFALRDGQRIPVHGGTGIDGTINVVGFSRNISIRDPELVGQKRELLVPGSPLARVAGEQGYPVNNGTSFLMALSYTKAGPKAKAFLTYSDTEDRTADDYTAATERFSKKEWRDVAFTDNDIRRDLIATTIVRG